MIVLSAEGVGLVLDVAGPRPPRVLHWGACPGPLTDLPPAPAQDLVPSQGDGWYGRPALAGHRDGAWRPPRFTLAEPVAVDGRRVEARATDPGAGLDLRTEIELTGQGVLRMRHEVVNTATSPYTLDRLACLMPVPAEAAEVLDFTGRWARERHPQRAPLRRGVWSRENRRGRTGFDAGPLVVGTPGFGFRTGEVWAVHVAWSGDHVQHVERLPEGDGVLAGAELLAPGEVRLGEGESYRTPWVYFATSDAGLDGLSRRLHAMLRARGGHPGSPRPVTMNTWEAVYFDHREDRLLALADAAAEVGAERFVVDDGWFRHRRDDRAGLGDWYVDETVWPDGLHALVRRVREHGMQFGLWFEPEMANPDSDLVRAHPDWLLADPGRLPRPRRHQHTLDLARPKVYAYLLERIGALVGEYGVDYVKWDHNRDLAEAVHDGIPGTHAQTEAVYRLLDDLRGRFPHLEIESCSSGGGRADLGVLERTDRIWASDTMDPFERQRIQRWTGLLIPYELMGTHVGSERAHITGRVTGLGFRAATALFGHAGIEADITAWTTEERAALAEWVALHKRLRPLLHGGEVVRVDHPDPAAWVHGVVSPDRGHAVFAYVQLETSASERPARMRLPGLDPDAEYAVAAVPGVVSGPPGRWPDWASGGVRLGGRALAVIGLAAPLLSDSPGTAFLVEAVRL
ncbi:alpha-galactosidase [Microbispora corallina]|uniref:Alpha-galactosidase n=1 Tax=Microbispora corallina TaxID=83302 RepID=A0ABQ4G121_9ACTN|nr:alpha-galactosidase [Microbispora corallina]GIH40771.1 alpha-galactosidase [Microbispora corallina]